MLDRIGGEQARATSRFVIYLRHHSRNISIPVEKRSLFWRGNSRKATVIIPLAGICVTLRAPLTSLTATKARSYSSSLVR